MCNSTTIDPIIYIKKRSIVQYFIDLFNQNKVNRTSVKLYFFKKEVNSTTVDPYEKEVNGSTSFFIIKGSIVHIFFIKKRQ